MKKIISTLLIVFCVLCLGSSYQAYSDTSSIRVTKAYYINNGKDLKIETAISNSSQAEFGGIYKVKIIVLDNKGSLIANNTFTDDKLKSQIIPAGQQLNWSFILPNAKKGDLSHITSNAWLSWSGSFLSAAKAAKGDTSKPIPTPQQPTNAQTPTATAVKLNISKVEYKLNNTKLYIYGTFVNATAKKCTNINNVKITIYDSKDKVMAKATFKDSKLNGTTINQNSQLSWLFIVTNPNVGDISKFKSDVKFDYK